MLFVFFVYVYLSWDCNPILTILPIMSVLFTHRCKNNGIWCDCHKSERFGATDKTRFNPPFSTFENACTKSGIWQLLSIRLMCFILWYCHLIRDFPFLISSEFSIFVILLFHEDIIILYFTFSNTFCIIKSKITKIENSDRGKFQTENTLSKGKIKSSNTSNEWLTTVIFLSWYRYYA